MIADPKRVVQTDGGKSCAQVQCKQDCTIF